jgi:hypothetical protein
MRHFIADFFLVICFAIAAIAGFYGFINMLEFLAAATALLLITLVYSTRHGETEEASSRFMAADKRREERAARRRRLATLSRKLDDVALGTRRIRLALQKTAYVID